MGQRKGLWVTCDIHMALSPLATLRYPNPQGLTQGSSPVQGQLPEEGRPRASRAVRMLCGALWALGTGSPWPHGGWMSPDTMLRKPNVSLTSPGEPARLLSDLRPGLLLGLGFPTGTDCQCQRACSAGRLPPWPSPGACGRL